MNCIQSFIVTNRQHSDSISYSLGIDLDLILIEIVQKDE